MTRAVPFAILGLLATIPVPSAALAQNPSVPPARGTRVRTVTDTLVGPVGGVTVDALGMIFVADFGNTVYKVQPDGRVSVYATGFYGASGNAIDSKGRLLQSSFAGNYISRVDRSGKVSTLAEGFEGPVGIAVDTADNLYVCNCRGNYLSRVTAAGVVSRFAESDLFLCPNGITRGPEGTLYVANFRDSRVLKVTRDGRVSVLATLPGGGNGHITFARGRLYVTSFQGHRIFEVSLEGEVTLLAGTGALGEKDGPALQAAFSWPNGIAASPQGDRLYVNDYLNRTPPTVEAPPVPHSVVRQITLPSFGDILAAALGAGGLDSLRATYQAWKKDPGTAGQFTELEVNALGYRLMGAGRLEAATAVFRLNAESYPNSFNTWDSLAESYMTAGKNSEAIRYYQKSLELNPANANATAMLEKLKSEK
ncbi:MAG: tetratricopeptide repeat protein [Gemmatimonadales bacterium]